MLKPITMAACLRATAAGLCATAAGLAAAAMAQAQSPTLSGQQISDLVAGATVEIDTPLGTKLPVRYGADGRLSGDAGELASYLGTATDKGRWWVAGDQLCHKWYRWFGSEPQCMRISREGRVFRWHKQDGHSGTATITVPATVQAAAVLPRVPQRIMRFVAPETPPASAADEPAPAEAAAEAAEPPKQAAKEEVAKAPPEPVPIANAVPAPAPVAPAPVAQAPAAPAKSPPPPKQAEPARPAQPMFMVANVRSDDVLNVRSGPSADSEVVGELPPGSRGIAITSACQAKWCPVQHGSTNGWVNSAFLAPEQPAPGPQPGPQNSSWQDGRPPPAPAAAPSALRDSPEAPRACLTQAARALLARIEERFGAVKVMSTCRAGAMIAGTARPSRHASGNAVDFDAGSRKAAIVEWLIANHHDGGTMTYAGLDHIHVDIGPHFVSLANGPNWASWRSSRRDTSEADERR
jgi:Bacterial SH3 domain/Peptidase M15